MEYLQSDGLQWIDTLVTLNSETIVDVQFEGVARILGVRNNSQSAAYGVYNDVLDIYSTFVERTRGRLTFTNDGTKILNAHLENGNRKITDNDGVVIGENNYRCNSFTIQYTCPLFALRWDSPNVTPGDGIRRIYYARFENYGLVREFIPVVKDGIPYMYDRISGELFGNAGSGTFQAGPRKE